MKKTIYYIFSAIVALGFVACQPRETAVEFKVDLDSITAEAEGGDFGVSLKNGRDIL